MRTVSLVFGILSILGMIVAAFPCLGSLNWLNIPFSVIGLIISIVALNQPQSEQKGAAIAGLVLCLIAIVLGFLRLVAGGGVI
ncbi:MAG: hypothetical protein AB1394_08010 [Bacteroidota bacterium]